MVAGLKFLSKKGFNPQNLSNQKRVWEREQEKKTEDRRVKERQEQLKRERDDEELARARGDSVKVNFMYKPPPGLETTKKPAAAVSSSSLTPSSNDVTQRQPGDDDAAAAFRAMLAAATAPVVDEPNSEQETGGIVRGTAPGSFGTVLQGSSYDKLAEGPTREEKQQAVDPSSLSALEKAVGRRQQSDSGKGNLLGHSRDK